MAMFVFADVFLTVEALGFSPAKSCDIKTASAAVGLKPIIMDAPVGTAEAVLLHHFALMRSWLIANC